MSTAPPVFLRGGTSAGTGQDAELRDARRNISLRPRAFAWRHLLGGGAGALAPENLTTSSVGPSTSLGSLLRKLTSGPAPAFDPARELARLRLMVEARLRRLDEPGASAGVARDNAARARLADDRIVGLLELMRQQVAVGRRTATPTVVALGRYGQCQLDRDGPLELLTLVPDQARKRVVAEGMARQLGDGLCGLGFAVANSISAPGECVRFALYGPRVLASLCDARYVAGPYGPWAGLRAGLEAALWGRTRPVQPW
jgi:hypothetical protein